jgi:hypothetical protein
MMIELKEYLEELKKWIYDSFKIKNYYKRVTK